MKSRETKFRRQLQQLGYRLTKSRKKISVDNLGGFMIVDSQNAVMSGSRFELSLDNVEEFISDVRAREIK